MLVQEELYAIIFVTSNRMGQFRAFSLDILDLFVDDDYHLIAFNCIYIFMYQKRKGEFRLEIVVQLFNLNCIIKY